MAAAGEWAFDSGVRWKIRSLVFRAERVTVTGAGRTDAGVHARGQVAHFDLAPRISRGHRSRRHERASPPATYRGAGCGYARHPTFMRDFPPSARSYEYRILCRRAPPALDAGRVWHVGRRLDSDAMQAGARLLIGQHDFTTFRAAECQAKSPVKTLDVFDVLRTGQRNLLLGACAVLFASPGAFDGRHTENGG